MKRLDLPTKTGSTNFKNPTIDHLLNSMPGSGMDTYEDRLSTFATLGFYFDGTDYSDESVRAVTKLIKRMDGQVPNPDTFSVVELEDEDQDRYGFSYNGIEYWFTSPSLKTMPKMKADNVPNYYRELINKTADHPDQVLLLPYYLFSSVGDTLGKSLGIV